MKEISCGCKEWVVHEGDTIVEYFDYVPTIDFKNFVVDHNCEIMTIIRKKYALKRTYYVKRENQESDTSTAIREVQGNPSGSVADELLPLDSYSIIPGGDYEDSQGES